MNNGLDCVTIHLPMKVLIFSSILKRSYGTLCSISKRHYKEFWVSFIFHGPDMVHDARMFVIFCWYVCVLHVSVGLAQTGPVITLSRSWFLCVWRATFNFRWPRFWTWPIINIFSHPPNANGFSWKFTFSFLYTSNATWFGYTWPVLTGRSRKPHRAIYAKIWNNLNPVFTSEVYFYVLMFLECGSRKLNKHIVCTGRPGYHLWLESRVSLVSFNRVRNALKNNQVCQLFLDSWLVVISCVIDGLWTIESVARNW